jgi:hypothetical protein
MFDPGSFRDRSGRVFHRNGRVYRALDAAAAQEWEFARQARFVQQLMEEGRIIRTVPAHDVIAPGDASLWHSVVEHERVPYVSYPYEWSFSMLRDAARLHLDLLEASLREQAILKDATPYNVQFVGAAPVFIDVASIVRLNPGDAWAGYRQFCQLMLYPLMLQAYRGVDFQSLLRGSLEGISPESMLRQLSWRDRLRRGAFSHVYLHARLQQRFGDVREDTRTRLRVHGFSPDLIRANIRRLRRIIDQFACRTDDSHWSEYEDRCPHVRTDAAAKEAFVRDVVQHRRLKLVWDLGCNTGRYARIAADQADCVVAMDSDPQTIDKLYRSLQKERCTRILPLVMDLADPSPGRGWRGTERGDLPSRGRPQLTLCLALLHHLVLARNLPLNEVIDWLADLGSAVVIEFVAKEDPQARALLQNRADQHSDYGLPRFEQLLRQRFHVPRREPLPSGTRTLFYAEPRTAEGGYTNSAP